MMIRVILIVFLNLTFFENALAMVLCTIRIGDVSSLNKKIEARINNDGQTLFKYNWGSNMPTLHYQLRFETKDKTIVRFNGTQCDKDKPGMDTAYLKFFGKMLGRISGLEECAPVKNGQKSTGLKSTDIPCDDVPEIMALAKQDSRMALTLMSGYGVRLAEITGRMTSTE